MKTHLEMDTEEWKAWNLGKAAHESGTPRDCNPFAEGALLWHRWDMGWCDAHWPVKKRAASDSPAGRAAGVGVGLLTVDGRAPHGANAKGDSR